MLSPAAGLAHLAGLPPSNVKMGLDRVRAALARLGDPQRQLKAVQVAGTNGKGSTCATLASCLSQRYLTGLYTSPHLSRVNERFQVDGAMISDEVLGQRVAEVVDALGEDHDLTYFELGTVVAFHHFVAEGVDLAVLETGLGGRLDAATACEPLVTCLTPVSFDHQQYLGTTLRQIATEKAGIIKAGVPVVSAAQAPEALEVIRQVAHEQHAPLWVEGVDFSCDGASYRSTHRRLEGLSSPLHGRHQHQNLAVALAGLELLGARGFELSTEQLRSGVHDTRWPGRLEELALSPLVVLDGAHNPAGVEVLVAALAERFAGRPVHLVFGVFADKDTEPMMRRLFPCAHALYLTSVDSPRSLAPERYLGLAQTLCPRTTVFPTAALAVEAARKACPADGVVLVAGSLHLIGQVRPSLLALAERAPRAD